MSKDLEQKLKEAEALVAAVRKQIEEDKELKPYDWFGKKRYLIAGDATVSAVHKDVKTQSLFYKKTREQAERFNHRLKILSCINNLKESLGCDWEFTKGRENFEIAFSTRWLSEPTDGWDQGGIYFSTGVDAEKVCKYLNKHYPNGWSLPKC